MPKGPRGERRPADVIGTAIRVAKIATGEEPEDIEQPTAAAELGRRGGLKAGKVRGERPRTDWAAFDAITDDDIAAAIRDDPDVAPELDAEWFASATLVMPEPKEQISIRLDRDVLEHFRRYPRYQTRISAILRAAMEHEKKAG